MEKILITGTGRCGTTFLIKLFSFLNFDTGYTKDNYKKYISTNCNSGMEKEHKENHYILKNPSFITKIDKIINDGIIIKKVIIPIRNLKESALSRVNHGKNAGGLWCATNEITQINFYKEILTNYIFWMTEYNIDTIFLDFNLMVNDKKYLFNKLKNILDEKNIDFYLFSEIYDEVSLTC